MRLLLGQAVLLLILAALAALAAGLPPAAEAQPAGPTLTGKRFSSTAGNSNTPEGGTESSGWYFYNDIIEAELTFSEAVTVIGSPYLELTIGPKTRTAAYHTGSGSSKLLFHYRVQSGDYDADGASIPQNALKLNYGSISGDSGYLVLNEASSPTELADDLQHKVDGSEGNLHPRYASKRGDEQVYDIGVPIPEFTLPAASGGNGALTYSAHFNPVGPCSPVGGSSGSSGGVGGSSSPMNLRDWMIYTPPGPGDTHGGKISAAPGEAAGTFKTPTAGLRGCLTMTVQDADADRGDDDQSHHELTITVKFDYDTDNDGLIEVSKLNRLDAIRYDLNGDGAQGTVNDADWAKYTAAFAYAMPGMGCPDTAADADALPGPCTGYELTANLDFDTDDDGATYTETGSVLTGDAGDAYYNGGAGWNPIGSGGAAPFTATFDGQGHAIANLFINVSATAGSASGLFVRIGSGGQVKNVGLLNVKAVLNRVLGGSGANALGGLAGVNGGTVSGSYATGAVNASFSGAVTGRTSSFNVGGLLGGNNGTVESSYSTAAVTATVRPQPTVRGLFRVGGLAGRNGGNITASYAAGPVKLSHGHDSGGLVGNNTGQITASYAVGAVAGTNARYAGALVGYNRPGGSITASYATGLVTSDAASTRAGGLIAGSNRGGADSYWDTGTTGQSASFDGVGKTTRELQTPTNTPPYTGIYANWKLDIDGDTTTGDASGKEDIWDFGDGHQYPVLKDPSLNDEQQQQQIKQQRRNFLSADNWGAPAVGDPVWATAPASANWQWQRETAGVWSDITGATAAAATTSAYIAAVADVGKRLRAVATYTESGIPRTLTTANTGAVAAAPLSAANIAQLTPTVGSAALHHRLDPAAGIAAANIHRWRWLRCSTATVTGTTCTIAASSAEGNATTSYTLTAADVGQYLQAQVYYAAGDAGQTWTRAWGPVVGPVIAAPAPTPPPSGPSGG